VRRSVLLLLAVWAAADCAAVSHHRFEWTAFNLACPTGRMETVAFSPLAFELDAVVFAEAADTLARAHVSETIGDMRGFEVVYAPVFELFDCRTNGLSLVTARGFCVPEIRRTQPALVQLLQAQYRTEVCRLNPKAGAEAWFRTSMDGEMEGFSPIVSDGTDGRYAFYDLLSVSFAWQDPFPTNNTRRLPFVRTDGTRSKRDFIMDIRPVDTWEDESSVMLSLPLRGQAEFLAILPKPGVALSAVKDKLGAAEADSLFTRPHRAEGTRVSHAPALVVLPKLDLTRSNDLLPLMAHFRFPVTGLPRLTGRSSSGRLNQIVRFRLDAQGPDEAPLAEKPVERQIKATADTRKIVLNRPFLFFIRHEPTGTIPLAGQYGGED